MGRIDFDESRPLGEQLREAMKKEATPVFALLKDFDTDKDGRIDKKEFRTYMPKLGFDLPRKVLDQVFDSFDLDMAGVSEFE